MDGKKKLRITTEGENLSCSEMQFLHKSMIMHGLNLFSQLNSVGIPSTPSGILEDAMNLQADDGQEKGRRLYWSSLENVEEGTKQKSAADGYQRQKDNQAQQRRDESYQQPEAVLCEEEVAKTPNNSSRNLQNLEFGGNRFLRESSVKWPRFPMKEKQCHPTEYGEGSRGSPEEPRFHTKQNPEKCLTPLKFFSVSNTLELFQPMPSEEKPSKPTECVMSLKESSKRNRHQRIQKGEKPYKRQDRGNYFNWYSDGLTRQRIHAAIKRFECEECGERFSQCSNLRLHQRIHSGEKPYLCEYCGENFSYFSQLIIHQRSHVGKKPYHCEECERNFTARPDIRKHLRIHTGEKLYECDRCEESFFHRKDLGEHKAIHSEESPYKCEECGESYRCRAQRIRHRQIHVGICKETLKTPYI